DQPSRTTDQLAEQLNVSSKTIERWRKAGLRWRWVKPADESRRRIGITQTALEHFSAQNPKRIARASALTQIPKDKHQQLLDKARTVSKNGASLNSTAATLA